MKLVMEITHSEASYNMIHIIQLNNLVEQALQP